MTHRRAALILLGCTFIWGASFTMVKATLDYLSPLVLLGTRFAAATLLLGPWLLRATREDWKAGAILAAIFWIQLALFTVGLVTTTPTRSAFLLSLAVPMVPVLLHGVLRQRPAPRELFGVALAVLGTWLVARPQGGSGIVRGDVYTVLSAVGGAAYVVAAGYWSRRHQPMQLLAVQLAIMGVASLALAGWLETPRFNLNPKSALLAGYLTLTSIATFGGQLLGQRLVRPTETAVIFALEPVFAALISFLALGEVLAPVQWAGGALLVGATLTVRGRASAPTPDSPIKEW